MIVLKNSCSLEIEEMFDTVAEFKEYVDKCLREMEDGMRADNLFEEGEGVCGKVPIEKAPFGTKLETFLGAFEITLSEKI